MTAEKCPGCHGEGPHDFGPGCELDWAPPPGPKAPWARKCHGGFDAQGCGKDAEWILTDRTDSGTKHPMQTWACREHTGAHSLTAVDAEPLEQWWKRVHAVKPVNFADPSLANFASWSREYLGQLSDQSELGLIVNECMMAGFVSFFAPADQENHRCHAASDVVVNVDGGPQFVLCSHHARRAMDVFKAAGVTHRLHQRFDGKGELEVELPRITREILQVWDGPKDRGVTDRSIFNIEDAEWKRRFRF